jgi:hypothetical protein
MARTVFLTTPRVSKKFKVALGDLCINFSILELTIDRTIWALRNHDRREGRKHTVKLLTNLRLETWRKEANKRFGEKSKAARGFKMLADFVGELAKQRHLFVHGLWSKGPRGHRRETFVLTYFHSPGGESYRVTVEEIQKLISVIAETEIAIKAAVLGSLGKPLA